MSIISFFDFQRTGGGGSSRPGSWRERLTFYNPLFDAMNRRNEEPTMLNIIFSFPQLILTIKR